MPSDHNNTLPRGFKAKAEKLSLEFREKLQVSRNGPLSALKLADHLNIGIFIPEDFGLSAAEIQNILGTTERDSGWSALTMTTAKNNKIIIHNNNHSPARQQSNLMHELAHIICEHKLCSINTGIALPLSMREYDPRQEEEANTLGAALIIPRPGLVWALKKGMSISDIGKHFIASTRMVQFRINSTGARKQLSYLK